MTAVGSMPELAFGNAQVRRQEASGESRGTVPPYLHHDLRTRFALQVTTSR